MEKTSPEKTVPEMIREAMNLLAVPATPADIVRWITKQYPETHESTIRTQITACCVNMPSRVNFAPNDQPRIAQDPTGDILYRLDFGQYVTYDPAQHGVWEVADFGGELVVRQVAADSPAVEQVKAVFETEKTVSAPEVEAPAREAPSKMQTAPTAQPAITAGAEEPKGGTMATESKNLGSTAFLRDLIKSNLGMLEKGMSLFTDSQGVPGIDYQTPLGPIDLLATDTRGNLVLVKLEEGSSPSFIGELCAQLGWVQENRAGKRTVRGIILTREAPEQLKYAVKAVPGVELMQYEFKFEVKRIT